MSIHQPLLTDRLDLRLPDPREDVAELFHIFSDPGGWWYDLASCHLDSSRTADWLSRAASRFDTDGLRYWTVRLRCDGTIIGAGGVQRQRTRAWNLSYRIASASQGLGYATELAAAGVAVASTLDPAVPVIAWIAEINTPSRRVADRLGLKDQGPAIDPSDGQERLAYADRPIGPFHG